ncbi:MAG TPA: putative baseplate assembly protein [Solirubrobacteraceae bacterium]|nr:putative baseplate assembly protein [Solirubrobacteraceae bacterium]
MIPPSVRLDPRTHADLTTEARARIADTCAELRAQDDPGETLIELFAWMTGLAIERLARVPDKLHIALLDMLGIELRPPAPARADLRVRLSAAAQRPINIRDGTEVGTTRTASEDSIVFHVAEPFTIAPLRPASYVIERVGAAREIGVMDGVAHPHGPDRIPFAQPPEVGDAFYLGFEQSIARLLVQVSLEASMARGAGVRPEDPPLRWEASQGDGVWSDVEVLADLTGGFNYGSGTVELQLPSSSGIEPIAGRRLHWLRCRIAETTRVADQRAAYQHAPEIYRITAAPVGALLPAEHSTPEFAEPLGTSAGDPGETFTTRFAPVLNLAPGESLEVQTPAGEWEAWEEVDSFADSGPEDRHFTIDLVHGLIRLGPEVHDPRAGITRHGSTAPKGAALRMSRYRHGGGRIGNVSPGALSTLRSAIPGVASVTNPGPAHGGVDPQSVRSARAQAALEIRTRHRAVTAQDYEFLATAASPRVARAVSIKDAEHGVTLAILPRIDPANRRLTIDELTPDRELLEVVAQHLDARKVVGCPVRLVPVRFRGVSVVVNLEASPRADAEQIEDRVRDALHIYLNPLTGGDGLGWPFGRPLHQGELYAVVQAVAGVDEVKILRLYEVDLQTGERASKSAGRQIMLAPDELIASGEHIVKVNRRER